MQVLNRRMLLLRSGAVLLLGACGRCVALIDLLHHVLFIDARKLQRNAGDALFEIFLSCGHLTKILALYAIDGKVLLLLCDKANLNHVEEFLAPMRVT